MTEKRNSTKPATATDVARLAGVSQSTVSRVFTKDCKIKVHEDARRRVMQAAEQLGYVPNAIAQIMTSGRSGIIGILVSDYFNLFYYQVLQLLMNALKTRGLRAMVFTSDPKDDLNELMENMYQYQVDGVVITSSALSHKLPHRWIQKGMPVVLINGYLQGMNISAVQSDQFGSGVMMADYLVKTGHCRFAYVSSENSLHHNYIPRQQGFIKGLLEHGVTDCRVIPAGYSYESGLMAGRELVKGREIPDAIFCSGDLNALGVIDAIRENTDLKIGRDVSVTGYDAPVLRELTAYSLTALSQQMDRLCEDCLDLLMRLIDHSELPPQVITRPMQLTVRKSSRPWDTQG
jgi:Transcriptional regulators